MIGAALVAAVALAAASPAPPDQVFVLAGQSNMAGRGQPLALASPPDPRLLLWRDGRWQTAADPLSTGGEAGVGPGMTFGLNLLRRLPSQRIGLVMCAVGGTSIEDWINLVGPEYLGCLDQVRAAHVRVAGTLFLQGEADARETRTQARRWGAEFEVFLRGWRRDFSGTFVLGQIGKLDPVVFPWQGIVRDLQAVEAAILGLPLVRTADLPVGPDGHFTVGAYRVIGARFAVAWSRAQRRS